MRNNIFKRVFSIILSAVLILSFQTVPAFAITKSKNVYEEKLFRDYGLDVTFKIDDLSQQEVNLIYSQLKSIGKQQKNLKQYIANRQNVERKIEVPQEKNIILLSTHTVTQTQSDGDFDITAKYTCTSGTPNRIGTVKSVRSKGNFTAWETIHGASWSQKRWNVKYLDSHRTAAITVFGDYTMSYDYEHGQSPVTLHNYELYADFGYVA